MSHESSTPESADAHLSALADAAWTLLASHPLDKIDFVLVADRAGVPHGLAAALGGSVQRLILKKMEMLDRQSLLETHADIEDAGAVSVREKIIEGLLHRFETYAPHRTQIAALNSAARTHPELALRLLDGLEAVIRRILVMSGDPANGLRGMMRVKGVAGVCMIVARVWMKDDSHDLAATMKALDQRMQQAEEWGASLRVFDRRRAGAAYDEDGGAADPISGGRYGVDND
jgi:hypothetical protein